MLLPRRRVGHDVRPETDQEQAVNNNLNNNAIFQSSTIKGGYHQQQQRLRGGGSGHNHNHRLRRSSRRRRILCSICLLVIVVVCIVVVIFVRFRLRHQLQRPPLMNEKEQIVKKDVIELWRKNKKKIIIPSPPQRRFPEYGTKHFKKQCPWVFHQSSSSSLNSTSTTSTCITYVTPDPKEKEGIAEWICKLVSGYIDSKVRHCELVFDYGGGGGGTGTGTGSGSSLQNMIQLDQIIQLVQDTSPPHLHPPFLPLRIPQQQQQSSSSSSSSSLTNTTTTYFQCNPNNHNCTSFARWISHNILTKEQRQNGLVLQPSGIHIPNYRHIFKNMTKQYNLYHDQFHDLYQFFSSTTTTSSIGDDDAKSAIISIDSTRRNSNFELRTGFACSINSIFTLANPQTSLYQSNLFTDLVPTLRDETSFTITIYVRSGITDIIATAEEKQEKEQQVKAKTHQQQQLRQQRTTEQRQETRKVEEEEEEEDTSITFETLPYNVQTTLQCAQHVESMILSQQQRQQQGGSKSYGTDERIRLALDGTDGGSSSSSTSTTLEISIPTHINHITWLVISDSVPLKDWITSQYHTTDTDLNQNRNHNHHNDQDNDNPRRRIPPSRRILTTNAKGTHTRAARHPKTTEFAEAMIDWYLMGEADILITSSQFYTFGTTAALRTAIPIINGGGGSTSDVGGGIVGVDYCKPLQVVQDGLSP